MECGCGAVYDRTTRDCRGECGPIVRVVDRGSHGSNDDIKICNDECLDPGKEAEPRFRECRTSDIENCKDCGFHLEQKAICLECNDDFFISDGTMK